MRKWTSRGSPLVLSKHKSCRDMFLSRHNYHPHLIFHVGWWCFWHISKTCIWSCFFQQCIKGLHGPAVFCATIPLGINVKRWKNDRGIKMLGETCVLFSASYYSYSKSSQKCYSKGLPWWHSGWESACQCGGNGFEPWSGRIPHAAEQLGPWATITEPARLEPVLRNKRGQDSERPAHRDEEWPPLAATRENPSTETKTQHSHK